MNLTWIKIKCALYAEVEALLIGTGPIIDFNDPKVKHHKDQFDKAIDEIYPALTETEESSKKNTSYVIRKSDYDYILDVLRGVKTLKDRLKYIRLLTKSSYEL